MPESFPALDFYLANVERTVWMVCKYGHAWRAPVPHPAVMQDRNFRKKECPAHRCRRCARDRRLPFDVHPDLTGALETIGLLAGGVDGDDRSAHHLWTAQAAKDWRAAMSLAALLWKPDEHESISQIRRACPRTGTARRPSSR